MKQIWGRLQEFFKPAEHWINVNCGLFEHQTEQNVVNDVVNKVHKVINSIKNVSVM